MGDEPGGGYELLATFYDRLQEDVDHHAWAKWLHGIVSASEASKFPQGDEGKLLWVDLGCGTGSFLLELAKLDYDLIGVDNSLGMLTGAREKIWSAGLGTEILLLQQDIVNFELYGTVNVCSILLDTVNHLQDRESVQRMLERCHTYLHQGGLLIFDVISEHHAKTTLGNQQFFVVEEDYALFWANHYDDENKRTRAELTLFEESRTAGRYTRSDSVIEEQIYADAVIREMLLEAGFTGIRSLEALSNDEANDKSGRVFYIAER